VTFASFEYLVFLVAVLAVYWLLPRRGQNALLLVASYLFYGWVEPWWALLLAGSTTLDYLCGRAMGRWPARRRAFLALSVTGNVGLLATFKAYDFFAQQVAAALATLGVGVSPPLLSVALPVGLSFYTFQSLSYTIDVARGHCAVRRDPLDFAVFVSLFPQLVAGPIERARRLLPQLEAERRPTTARVESALRLLAWGFFQKLVIADNLAPYVDRVFELDAPAGIVLLAGTAGFALQILADFGGYTDIARGSARLLGIELVRNFDAPYAARSPSDFWRRWHTSFSSWIRDYLYIPLGGSRVPRGRFLLVVMVTMTLSGLWHGAAWNFVLWGVWHGLLVLVEHLLLRRTAPRIRAVIGEVPATMLATGAMFCATLAGWVVFRQQDLGRLLGYAGPQLVHWTPEDVVAGLGLLSLVGLLALPMLAVRAITRAYPEHRLVRAALAWSCLLGVFVLGRESGVDFIYFAF